jgi:hypothetical protein
VLPTLWGRIQTRVLVLAVIGGLVTWAITPVLPDDPTYRVTFIVLAAVIVVGVVWEVIYHGLQQFRWEKDWPTLLGLVTAVNEGVVIWVLLQLDLVPGIDTPPTWAPFVVQFVAVWLVTWVWVNGPMRVPFIRWRFRGGRLI